jgi:hypothetical protein
MKNQGCFYGIVFGIVGFMILIVCTSSVLFQVLFYNVLVGTGLYEQYSTLFWAYITVSWIGSLLVGTLQFLGASLNNK